MVRPVRLPRSEDVTTEEPFVSMLKTYAVALTVTDAESVAIGRRVLAAGRAAVVVRVGGFVGVVPALENELAGIDYRIEIVCL